MWSMPSLYKKQWRLFERFSNNERREKNKSIDIEAMVPAELDARSDRAGWLPALSYSSALLCSVQKVFMRKMSFKAVQ
jgi:hypothetical protein